MVKCETYSILDISFHDYLAFQNSRDHIKSLHDNIWYRIITFFSRITDGWCSLLLTVKVSYVLLLRFQCHYSGTANFYSLSNSRLAFDTTLHVRGARTCLPVDLLTGLREFLINGISAFSTFMHAHVNPGNEVCACKGHVMSWILEMTRVWFIL